MADLKETGLKLFNTSKKWVLDRFYAIDIFDEHYAAEAKTNPWYSLGSLVWLFWMVTIVTGCVLMAWYIPSISEAYNSVLRIQYEVPLGNLVRGMHKYGADAVIIAATMRLYRIFLACDYKPHREFNVAIGLITLLLGMYSGLTGYLLIWNQRAFWATKVFATFPTYVESFYLIGPTHVGINTSQILLGGSSIGQATLTRFYAYHIAFTLIALIAVEIYFYRNGLRRFNIPWKVSIIPIVMVLIAAIVLPAQLGHRANPAVTPLPILSDWYFLALYQFLKYIEPVWATAITVFIPLTVVILPFFDLGPEKNIWKRPIFLMVVIMGLVECLIFSGLIIANIANIHRDPPIWRAGTCLLVGIGIVWQYINMKLEKPEKLPIALGDFFFYVIIPIFLLFYEFPFPMHGFLTLMDQIIAVAILAVLGGASYAWYFVIKSKLKELLEKNEEEAAS